MLKRKVYDILLEWCESRRKNKVKECLSIRGARQVGKTFIVEQFGKKNYDTFVEINFSNYPQYKQIFDGELSTDEIFKKLTLSFPQFSFSSNSRILIFLDEIQKCSNARTALKVMATDFRYDVITSGSLLGLTYGSDADKEVKEPSLLPVGYERIVNLYSLDFEEFLWALGYKEDNISLLYELAKKKEKISDLILNKYRQLFKEYMIVGGMPEVVKTYVETKNFNEVSRIQSKIINDYRDDIATHAKGSEKIKVRKCFDSIPSQLSKEITKFQYSQVESGQTSKKYGDSIQWLIDSQLVYACRNVHEPYIPLKGNEIQNQFKLYLHDTGLLLEMYGAQTKLMLMKDLLKGNIKGGIFENIIAEVLAKNGNNLFYYHPDDNNEIEFLLERNMEVIPLEVKATNSQTISLNKFINKFKPSVALKAIDGNVGLVDSKYTLPHFLIFFLVNLNDK